MNQPRILIVEDDEIMLELVCAVAADVGFAVEAVTGRGVEDVYRHFKPDVIILDILMPDMDGIEILSLLRAEKSKSRIIILSADDKYRAMAGRLGADLNIEKNFAKPFRVDQLHFTLKEIYERCLHNSEAA